jgi:hypothetical protein
MLRADGFKNDKDHVEMTYRCCHRFHTLSIQPVFIQHGKQCTPFVAMQGSESADVGPRTEKAAAGFDFHQRPWERGGEGDRGGGGERGGGGVEASGIVRRE